MGIKCSVRSLVAIEHAEILCDRIALLVGHNEAGKSTIAGAVGAALCGEASMRGITKINQYGRLVRTGYDKGVCRVESDEGFVEVTWPSGEVETHGTPPHASPFAAGRLHIAKMKESDRATALTEILMARPTRDDLEAAMTEVGLGNVKTVDLVWNQITENGWDATNKKTRDRNREKKGAWEQITKDRWGETKAEDWYPEGWTNDLAETSEDALKDAVTAARAALDSANQRKGAESARIEDMRARAETLPDEEKRVAEAEAKLEALSAEALALRDALNAMPRPVAQPEKCPHCGEPVQADRDGKISKADPVDPKEFERRRAAIDAKTVEVDNKNAQVYDAQQAVQTHKAALQIALNAKVAVEAHDAQPAEERASEDEINQCREVLQLAEKRLNLFVMHREATKTHKQIKAGLHVIDITDAKGLRRKKLKEKLESWNTNHLHTLSEIWGCPDVQVDDDLNITMGGRAYDLLSAGAQFAADCILSISIGKLDESDMVVIDAAEVLVGPRLSGLFKTLAKANVPAIVAVALKKAQSAPDLRKLKAGITYWLEGGGAEEVAG